MERRVIEFLLPILYSKKPKTLSITMANTIFGGCPDHDQSIGGNSSKNWWRDRSPTLTKNPLLSPRTFSTSTITMGASTRGGRRLDNCWRSGRLQVGAEDPADGGKNERIIERLRHPWIAFGRTHPRSQGGWLFLSPERRQIQLRNRIGRTSTCFPLSI